MDTIATISSALTTGTVGARQEAADPALQAAHEELQALLAREYPGLRLDQLQNGQRERLRGELRRRQAEDLLQATMRLLHALSDQSPETAAAIGVNLQDIRAQHVAISDVYVTHLQAEQPPAPGDPPYKGLSYFDVEDAAIFFGREALTAELVDYLRDHRFLAVVGASGSGKSIHSIHAFRVYLLYKLFRRKRFCVHSSCSKFDFVRNGTLPS